MKRLVLALVPSLLLTACAASEMSAYDPHQRFYNKVESRELTASFTADALGNGDRAALRDLAREHVRRGAASIAVTGPQAKAEDVAAILRSHGVAADRIVVSPGEGGATQVSVPIWVAVVPECGQWSSDLTSDLANQNTDNFGCAVTRNIGLMVSDPADLVRARDSTGRDGNRATDVIGKYGQGKATSSAAETGAADGLSSVGK